MGFAVNRSGPHKFATTLDLLLEFCARHHLAPTTELFPMSEVKVALEPLRARKARYRRSSKFESRDRPGILPPAWIAVTPDPRPGLQGTTSRKNSETPV